jgi:hypothetical protein
MVGLCFTFPDFDVELAGVGLGNRYVCHDPSLFAAADGPE